MRLYRVTVVRLVVSNLTSKKNLLFFVFYGNLNLSDDFLKNKKKLGPNGENWSIIFVCKSGFLPFLPILVLFLPFFGLDTESVGIRLDCLTFLKCANPLLLYEIGDSSRKLCQQKVSQWWNWPIFLFLVLKPRKINFNFCQNSPWTNFHHFGKKQICSFKVSNEHKRRKKRRIFFFDVKARTTVRVSLTFQRKYGRLLNFSFNISSTNRHFSLPKLARKLRTPTKSSPKPTANDDDLIPWATEMQD
jgi:hypothetical protein